MPDEQRGTVSLQPASPEELAAYLAIARQSYIDERIRAGDDPAAAVKNADDSYRSAFPDGRPANGHLVFSVRRDRQPVGLLWIGPQTAGSREKWWVWDIEIGDAFRGQGIGRQAMLLAEAEARTRGATELGLNVFGHNTIAIELYRSLGYEMTAMQMRKPVGPGPERP
jgi:ribosomal protein S18 acetylase RimI-like enzyme